MTESPLDDGTDVNEVVTAEWEAETTPFERVRTVMKRTYESQSADEVAERALTTPTTARRKLQLLVDEGYVEPVSAPDRQATLYRRSAASLVTEQAREILGELDLAELTARINDLQAEVRGYREETGVDAPEDAALEATGIDRETLRAWQGTQRNLKVAKAALAIGQAEDTVEPTTAP